MCDIAIINGVETTYSSGNMLRKDKDYYLHGLINEKDFIEIEQQINEDGIYRIEITHFSSKKAVHSLLIDNKYYGSIKFQPVNEKGILKSASFPMKKGGHKITLLRGWGELTFHSMKVVFDKAGIRTHKPAFQLSNPNASKEAQALMAYFKRIYGKKIITGQHTDINCTDVDYIERVTGKLPALLGFDMMSYSAATKTEKPTWDCMREVSCCKRNVDAAIYWATERKALITLCWHWYSPNYGRDKSFYTVNTDFDLGKTLNEKTEDYQLLLKDIDLIAGQLKKFQAKNIPILWRPLHEADGKWFWWGASGPEAYKELYRLMYDRLTNLHGLNNLIWIVNAPSEGWYPGDDVVDLNGMDIYAPAGNDGPLLMEYNRGNRFPTSDKPIGLSEIGILPDLERMMKDAGWLWFMLWGGFTHDEVSNTKESLIHNFTSPYALCMDEIRNAHLY